MKKLDVHFIFRTVTNSSAFKQNSFIYEKKLFHALHKYEEQLQIFF